MGAGAAVLLWEPFPPPPPKMPPAASSVLEQHSKGFLEHKARSILIHDMLEAISLGAERLL